MNLAGSDWLRVAWTQVWQVTVLILAVALLLRCASRNRPQLAFVLWLVVFLSCGQGTGREIDRTLSGGQTIEHDSGPQGHPLQWANGFRFGYCPEPICRRSITAGRPFRHRKPATDPCCFRRDEASTAARCGSVGDSPLGFRGHVLEDPRGGDREHQPHSHRRHDHPDTQGGNDPRRRRGRAEARAMAVAEWLGHHGSDDRDQG